MERPRLARYGSSLSPEMADGAVHVRKRRVVWGREGAFVLRAVVPVERRRELGLVTLDPMQQRAGRQDQQNGDQKSRHGSLTAWYVRPHQHREPHYLRGSEGSRRRAYLATG